MNTEQIRAQIKQGAEEIRRLRHCIYATFAHRGEGQAQHDAWLQACAEFHSRYSELAFPGGYDGALKRVLAGDPLAVEAALCFLEQGPYFFRSGYMFKQLLPKVKRAPISVEQAKRLTGVLICIQEWRANKQELARGLPPPPRPQPD